MVSSACAACGAPTDSGFGEFRELRGTEIAVLDVPARICFGCGTAAFTSDVMRRLAVILEAAADVADAEGRHNLVWTYTATGPPEFGELGTEMRQALASLSDALWTESRLMEATARAAQALDPWVLLH